MGSGGHCPEEFKVPQILVLSGVGARQYCQAELGYNLVANYMVKKVNTKFD